MEQLSLKVKLAVTAGLLCGLAFHCIETAQDGDLSFSCAKVSIWLAVTLIFGLIVTVQGVETPAIWAIVMTLGPGL